MGPATRPEDEGIAFKPRVRLGDRTWDLDPGACLVIGRGSDAHIVVAERTVSRRHAILEVDERGVLILRDLGSANTTQLNEAPQREAIVLRRGDRVGVGSTVLLVSSRLESHSSTRPLKPQPPAAFVVREALDALEAARNEQSVGAAQRSAAYAIARIDASALDPVSHLRLDASLLWLGESDGFWLDRLLELRTRSGTLPDASTLERLVMMHSLGCGPSTAATRAFLEGLADVVRAQPLEVRQLCGLLERRAGT